MARLQSLWALVIPTAGISILPERHLRPCFPANNIVRSATLTQVRCMYDISEPWLGHKYLSTSLQLLPLLCYPDGNHWRPAFAIWPLFATWDWGGKQASFIPCENFLSGYLCYTSSVSSPGANFPAQYYPLSWILFGLSSFILSGWTVLWDLTGSDAALCSIIQTVEVIVGWHVPA